MGTKLMSLLRNIVVTTGTAVVIVIIEGIIGNRADSIFLEVWPVIDKLMIGNLFTCVCTALVVVPCLVLTLYWRQRQKIAERMLEIEHAMLSLDDSFIRELAILSLSSQIEQDMQRILIDLLRDATVVFGGEVQRAALLVLNSTQDYLECLASYQMPLASIQNMRFYVGSDQHLLDVEKGVAGEAFTNGKVIVAHLGQINGNWVCEDNENYKKFIGKRPYPPYISFVNVPVIGINVKTAYATYASCVGVLCFDSPNKKIFDSEESKAILLRFARRVSAALLIYQRYQNTNNVLN